jgi:deoxyuridine 5'-triphosphate nucleotidohydrolase
MFTKLDPEATTPSRATTCSAGYDLASAVDAVIEPNTTVVIPTGVTVSFDKHMYGQILGRSSLAIRGITVLGGVIDADYTGEIRVILNNLSATPYKLVKGQRIAQMVLNAYYTDCDTEDVETVREGGFGSTD